VGLLGTDDTLYFMSDTNNFPTAFEILEQDAPVSNEDIIGQVLKSCSVKVNVGYGLAGIQPINAYLFLDTDWDGPIDFISDEKGFKTYSISEPLPELGNVDPFLNGTAETELGSNLVFIAGVMVTVDDDINTLLKNLREQGYSEAVKSLMINGSAFQARRFLIMDRFDMDPTYSQRGATEFTLRELKSMTRADFIFLDPMLTNITG
jgi:hypothetical protein